MGFEGNAFGHVLQADKEHAYVLVGGLFLVDLSDEGGCKCVVKVPHMVIFALVTSVLEASD